MGFTRKSRRTLAGPESDGALLVRVCLCKFWQTFALALATSFEIRSQKCQKCEIASVVNV